MGRAVRRHRGVRDARTPGLRALRTAIESTAAGDSRKKSNLPVTPQCTNTREYSPYNCRSENDLFRTLSPEYYSSSVEDC